MTKRGGGRGGEKIIKEHFFRGGEEYRWEKGLLLIIYLLLFFGRFLHSHSLDIMCSTCFFVCFFPV